MDFVVLELHLPITVHQSMSITTLALLDSVRVADATRTRVPISSGPLSGQSRSAALFAYLLLYNS